MLLAPALFPAKPSILHGSTELGAQIVVTEVAKAALKQTLH